MTIQTNHFPPPFLYPDGAIMARPKLAGRQRRLTGHKYLRNKLSHRVSLPADSSCEGRVSLHFTRSGFLISTAAGVVAEKGSEHILAHTVPRELDGHPLGCVGRGFGLVPGYTTLSVRVRANINSLP